MNKVITKKRDANLDLLRIVSMLLIIFLHSIDHSGVLEASANSNGVMQFYVQFTYALCQVCVNCYVLLSGYYLVKSKFRFQKLIALWMETVFYALIIRVIFMGTGLRNFSLGSIISCFVPILTGRYWFITIYVGMYLLSPFLNTAIRAMDRQQHGFLNLILFLIMSLWSSIHPSIAGMNSGEGWGLSWFVVLYLLAAWFRIYYVPSQKSGWYLLAFFTVALLMAVAKLGAAAMNIGIVKSIVSTWYKYNSAPVYLATVFLFLTFLNIRIGDNRISQLICKVAPLTFGVYLFHAHADLSSWIWNTAALPAKMDSALFVLIQIGVVFVIFIAGIIIDYIRSLTVGKIENWDCLKKIDYKITSLRKIRTN